MSHTRDLRGHLLHTVTFLVLFVSYAELTKINLNNHQISPLLYNSGELSIFFTEKLSGMFAVGFSLFFFFAPASGKARYRDPVFRPFVPLYDCPSTVVTTLAST